MRITYITSWSEVPVLFDVAYACRLCGVGPNLMRSMCASGKVPAHKVGSNWRFDKDEFRKWLETS